MFIAGADGQTPELRAASIKGVIRYWWRALQGEPNLEELRKRETELFGGAGSEGGKEKKGGRKSAVKIFVSLYPEKGDVSNDSFCDNQRNNPKNPDLNYLFYSVRAMQNRRYFHPLTPFKVTFIARKSEDIQEALRAFLAASLFGGLGSRTRRGGGSFWIKKIEADKMYVELPENINSPADLKNYIQKVVSPKNYAEDYSCLKKANLYIYDFQKVYDFQKDWIKALNTVATPFVRFRRENQAKAALTPIFGLPLSHKNGNIKSNIKVYPKIERRASPLVVKIIAARNKEEKTVFFPVFLCFSNRFLPENYTLEINKEGKTKPNKKLLDKFLQNLKGVKAQIEF
jgi:CRISPR-associated protein Cmr1